LARSAHWVRGEALNKYPLTPIFLKIMLKSHEIELMSEITDVLNRYIVIHQPTNLETLIVLASLYVNHVKKTEEVVSRVEEVEEIRDQAIELIGSQLYEDGLVEEEGTYH